MALPGARTPAALLQLTNSLQSHYIGALLRQLYKIVGSFDFLGDPVGVLSQVWTYCCIAALRNGVDSKFHHGFIDK